MKLIVDKESIIYDYLRDNLNESKNTIKGFLSKRMVTINNKVVTKYDYKVHPKDEIMIGNTQINNNMTNIDIVYEDNFLIAVNKPSNLLTIATEKEKERTLYNMVSSYVKEKDKSNKIFIIHRLDKDTSGIVLFAKDEKTKKLFQNNWNDNVKRTYLAVVHGKTKAKASLVLGMKETRDGLNTYVDNNGDKTITNYTKIVGNEEYSYIEIDIKTGKKNQIRVALSHTGNPILGDHKYGIKDDSKRMMLHAYKLEFINPLNKKKMELVSKPSKVFNYYKKLCS